ncbi:DUF6075 family protein [Candidatus Contubernalis alkaliaceticus]|uniref:DUF6075 family protein n=1 Tax=Candidatus Contubernalis alkaliaceticus TaxID=338645 RepID=UPI001F4BFB79|nr:DUF6075 family protein [Candidatus Contubernalis alkalaceticus]UNC90605.1 hypothetical protein HUE98_08100 [Candidatus Contubernalis alkalaceticus]
MIKEFEARHRRHLFGEIKEYLLVKYGHRNRFHKENRSTPYKLLDCSFAPYLMEAIRLRYPEYCRSMKRLLPYSFLKER